MPDVGHHLEFTSVPETKSTPLGCPTGGGPRTVGRSSHHRSDTDFLLDVGFSAEHVHTTVSLVPIAHSRSSTCAFL